MPKIVNGGDPNSTGAGITDPSRIANILNQPGMSTSLDVASFNRNLDALMRNFDEFQKTMKEKFEKMQNSEGHAELDVKIDDISARMLKFETELDRLNEDAQIREMARATAGDDLSPEGKKYRDATFQYLRDGNMAKLDATLESLSADYRSELITTTDTAGGFVVEPEYEQRIRELSEQMSVMRQISDVQTIGTQEYVTTWETGDAGYRWATEGGTAADTDTPTITQIKIPAEKLELYPKATLESLSDPYVDLEAWLMRSLMKAIRRAEGTFVNGTGSGEPRGLLSGNNTYVEDASWAKSNLARVGYIKTANNTGFFTGSISATNIPENKFIDVVAAMEQMYYPTCHWLMNRKTLAAVRKMADTDGRSVVQYTAAQATPMSLLGYPIMIDDYMDDVGANKFPVAFIADGTYTIVDRMGISMLRDPYTQPRYVRFYTIKRVGGMITNYESVKLLSTRA